MSTFCRLPFEGLDITPQGEYKPCCKYKNTVATSLKEYIDSDELQNIKADFFQGKRPVGCSRCWEDEDAGIISKRQLSNQQLESTKESTTYKIISFPMGNMCNLACRHCSSYPSSRWAETENKLKDIIPGIRVHKFQQHYRDIELIEQIKLLSKDAVLLEFPGGEPFYTGVEQHKDYLRFLLDYTPEHKSLHYMTNGTIFPDDELWEIWKQFKNVDIQISLDDIGERFEYMRWPAKWDEVYQNIKRYQKKGNIQLSISYTVSILNVYYLPEFLLWCEEEELPKPYIGLVAHRPHYSIQNLPTEVKLEVVKKLSNPETKFVIDYMMTNTTLNTITEFNLWTNALDELRQQEYSRVFPEFAQHLKGL